MGFKIAFKLYQKARSATNLVSNVVSKGGKAEKIKSPCLANEPVCDTLQLSLKNSHNPISSNSIEPKLFPSPDEGELNLFWSCKPFKYFDNDNARFLEEIKPKMLELCKTPHNEEVTYISNFDAPCGTIAGFSTLNKTLYTDKLAQCSAMTIVDKKNNLQVMVHLFPGYSEKNNTQIFEYIFSKIKDKSNIELSIVPGYAGDVSSQYLTDIAEQFAPNAKLNYYNFPRSNIISIFKRGLVLKDGKLSCCNQDYFTNRNINPSNSIVACKYSPD